MVKLMASTKERIVAKTPDGKVVILTDDAVLVKVKGKEKQDADVNLDDLLLMNKTLFTIFKPYFELIQKLQRENEKLIRELMETAAVNTITLMRVPHECEECEQLPCECEECGGH